jgi:hypothetical protein
MDREGFARPRFQSGLKRSSRFLTRGLLQWRVRDTWSRHRLRGSTSNRAVRSGSVDIPHTQWASRCLVPDALYTTSRHAAASMAYRCGMSSVQAALIRSRWTSKERTALYMLIVTGCLAPISVPNIWPKRASVTVHPARIPAATAVMLGNRIRTAFPNSLLPFHLV